MNEHKPLWLRDKEELKKADYNEFYKALFKDTVDPLTHNHFTAEG